jgi:hypothetical protein
MKKIPAGPMSVPRVATAKRLGNLVPATPPALIPRIFVYATEKFGKTSMAAHAPEPVIFMSKGETGYMTLLSAGSIPAVPAVLVETWSDLLGFLDDLNADTQGRKTVVLDAIGGFEALCRQHVCTTRFGGDWGEAGFAGFARGNDMVATEWLGLLDRLDRLHSQGIIIIVIGHATVKTMSPPDGAAFDRYQPDVHQKVLASTSRWADAILFGKFFSMVETVKNTGNIAKDKGKGIGGTTRVIYTQSRDAMLAGGRYRGMPNEFSLPDEPSAMWSTVWDQINKCKEFKS